MDRDGGGYVSKGKEKSEPTNADDKDKHSNGTFKTAHAHIKEHQRGEIDIKRYSGRGHLELHSGSKEEDSLEDFNGRKHRRCGSVAEELARTLACTIAEGIPGHLGDHHTTEKLVEQHRGLENQFAICLDEGRSTSATQRSHADHVPHSPHGLRDPGTSLATRGRIAVHVGEGGPITLGHQIPGPVAYFPDRLVMGPRPAKWRHTALANGERSFSVEGEWSEQCLRIGGRGKDSGEERPIHNTHSTRVNLGEGPNRTCREEKGEKTSLSFPANKLPAQLARGNESAGDSSAALDEKALPRRLEGDEERRSFIAFHSGLARSADLHTQQAPRLVNAAEISCRRPLEYDRGQTTNGGDHHQRSTTRLLSLALRGFKTSPSSRADLSDYLDASLPLHVKVVPRIDWNIIEAFVSKANIARSEFEYAKKWTVDASTIASATVLAHACPKADITPHDLGELMAHKYVRKLQSNETPLGFVELFTTKEKLKWTGSDWAYTRRRLITVPWYINLYNDVVAETRLPSRSEVAEGLLQEGASTHDISAYYVHFPLPEDSQLFYCFCAAGDWFCLLTIPTGGRHCPALAQALSASIASETLKMMQPSECDRPQVLAYLDNFRIAGSQEAVEIGESHLYELARSLNILLAVEKTFSSEYEFLGLACTHQSQNIDASTAATPKAIEKLKRSWAEATHEDATLRSGLRLLGSLVWISSASDVNLANFYVALKFFRRRCASTAHIDMPLDMWNCAKPNITQWLRACCNNKPRIIRKPNHLETNKAVLWTDACEDGFGVVLFARDELGIPVLHVVFGPWTTMTQARPHINVLEACALLIGARVTAALLAGDAARADLRVFIDSSTLHGFLHRGYSPKYWANVAAKLVNEQPNIFRTHSVSWVPTFANVADLPSRASGEGIYASGFNTGTVTSPTACARVLSSAGVGGVGW